MIRTDEKSLYISSRLLLYGKDLNPDHINSLSKLPSGESYRAGDVFNSGVSARKSGMWSIIHYACSGTADDGIDYFLDAFSRDCRPLTAVPSVESARVSLWVKECMIGSSFELLMGLDYIEKVRELGADFYITYFKNA